MSTEENKRIARRHFDELWAQGKLEVADEIYSSDCMGRYATHPEHGGYPECEKEGVRGERAAVPDMQVTILDQIAEGDTVVTIWEVRGTNSGEMHGIPPSGNPIRIQGTHRHRIRDGKIAEAWAVGDLLGLLQQVGVVPPLAS